MSGLHLAIWIIVGLTASLLMIGFALSDTPLPGEGREPENGADSEDKPRAGGK